MNYLSFVSKYDRFPTIKMDSSGNELVIGYGQIIDRLRSVKQGVICFETYPGINQKVLLNKIIKKLKPDDIIFSEDFTIDDREYESLLSDYIYEDRIFGRYSHHQIEDFYKMDLLKSKNDSIDRSKLTVVYGFGASLFSYEKLVFVSLTRWEIQLRYRNGLPNFKKNNPNEDILRKYKLGYFITWRVADRIKEKHIKNVDFLIDLNLDDSPKMISKYTYEKCLDTVVRRPFRVVPYFDPGVWGGQWMKEVCNLDPDQVNYAWCFDGVPEENSVRFAFKEAFIEFPAQDLVLYRPNEFMGKKVHDIFGKNFPIRFDFLDTMNGENLSLQVHPKTDYIQKYFGMNFTQEESYYILDAEEDSSVYLGVKNGIDQNKFKQDLIEANQNGQAFLAEEYVNRIPVKKHDHLLIPSGTIHCSGKNTMVLEISSGVYIFTFKLWDWGRLGLDGLPRPVSLEHGFRNIKFEHNTNFVENELVNQFLKVNESEEITGLHSLQFIESRRYTFETSLIMETKRGVNVCNLVEGQAMKVVSLDNAFEPFEVHYAETFYIPATIEKVKFVSLDSNRCIVIKASIK